MTDSDGGAVANGGDGRDDASIPNGRDDGTAAANGGDASDASSSRAWTVARDDLRAVRRSRLLWGAFGLVFLLVVPTFWSTTAHLRPVEGRPAPAVQAVLNVPSYLSTYLFLLVLVLAYGAVASERESGSVRSLLTLSATRRDVLIGKLLARTLALVAVVGSLLVLLGTIVVVRQGTVPVVDFVLVAGWVLVYGVVWTAFAVGLSAAVDSQYRALAAVGGTYVVLAWNAPVWKAVLRPALAAVLPAGSGPYVDALNPTISLSLVGEWLVVPGDVGSADVGAGAVAVSVAVLFALGATGVLVGSRRFERADLG